MRYLIKKKIILLAVIFSNIFNFILVSMSLDLSYAITKNKLLYADNNMDDEEEVVDDLEQQCPNVRNDYSTPEEFIDKINPLRKEPRNLKKGKVLYRLKAKRACKFCHGMEGKGDGSMADLADKPPRNLTCKEYMNKITDGEIFWVIKEGIEDAGMPSYKHLSDKKIWQLIQYIRTFSTDS